MDREIIIKVFILVLLIVVLIMRILVIEQTVVIILILLVAILLVIVIIEIERRQKTGPGEQPGDGGGGGEPPNELDDTITELEGKCDLIERFKRGRPRAQQEALDAAKQKVKEAKDKLKRLRNGDRDPNLEGDIQRALREAADKVDQANPNKGLPLKRLAEELRDIERNLF